jgi:hypothetical protein
MSPRFFAGFLLPLLFQPGLGQTGGVKHYIFSKYTATNYKGLLVMIMTHSDYHNHDADSFHMNVLILNNKAH